MSEIAELIERLEKATGPDQDLDLEIARAIDGPAVVRHSSAHMDYTASLDAALTLVPEGYWWEVKQVCAPTSPMRNFGRSGMFMAATHHNYGESGISGSHDKPALALCIAALRARATESRR